MTKPDTATALAGLKDFQRATVDHVFRRLYQDADSTRRFLVADEVGLGKTLVARGVIARVIDELWDKVPRIDVIYICSNADIARQNVRKLGIPGCTMNESLATRLTLLPLQTHTLAQQRVNFVALTPGTSFERTSGGGVAEERLLLHGLLERAGWFSHLSPASVRKVMADWMDATRFKELLARFDHSRVDEAIATRFIDQLNQEASASKLRQRLVELCDWFPQSNSNPGKEAERERGRWLSELRGRLATACLSSLKPDLIILDEFQRFRDLLDDESEAEHVRLARDLFNYASHTAQARTLLLSATPYKMLSLHHEQGEDHYRDLLKTLTFLEPGDWQSALRQYQDAMFNTRRIDSREGQHLLAMRNALATRMRRVMVRTERLAAAPERGGMLHERVLGTDDLQAQDVRHWLALQSFADALKQGDSIDYWKSAPYVLSFMDRYQLKKAFVDACQADDTRRAMIELVRTHEQTFLPAEDIARFKAVPLANARLRALKRETLDAEQWRWLWTPPAMPYYELAGVYATEAARSFTKSLVFSSWHVVPKAVSALLSYEAERAMVRSFDRKAQNTVAGRKKRRPLLRFADSNHRLTGLPLLTLVYPCITLAEQVDPQRLAPGKPLSTVLKMARAVIQELLKPLSKNAPTDGPEDEAWYWLAPMLLDNSHHSKASAHWWEQPYLATSWLGSTEDASEDHHQRWDDHVAEAGRCVHSPQLGRVPDDLADVLARMAIAAPATTTLRAMARCGVTQVTVRLAAAQAGHAFLSLFNLPEVIALLRSRNADEPYWRRVLEYACEGCLQSVLDEFLHLLCEDQSTLANQPTKLAVALSKSLCEVIRLRTAVLRADAISAPDYAREVWINRANEADAEDQHRHLGHAMRLRFAMRYGDERSDSAGATAQAGNRKERVRDAFNSPFWPFVLITTSVGQEGLDFHRYCHRVVHWNLPANPVDLEQREGRVHRYKGHAVRKNIAAEHGAGLLLGGAPDLWSSAFQAAAQTRTINENELIPYWLYPGAAKIERCIPQLPLSKEVSRLHELKHALTVYRMAFGHTRQEDVIEHLLAHVSEAHRTTLSEALHISLSP